MTSQPTASDAHVDAVVGAINFGVGPRRRRKKAPVTDQLAKWIVTDIPIAKRDDERRLVFGWANVPHPAIAKAAAEGSAEEAIQDIAEEFYEQFPNNQNGDWTRSRWVVATFPDEKYLIASQGDDFQRFDWTDAAGDDGDGDGDLTFTPGPMLEQRFVEKALLTPAQQRLAKSKRMELLEGIVKAKVDLQGDIVPIAELENAAYEFVLKAGAGNVNHAGPTVAHPVESFVATLEKYTAMGIPEEIAKGLNEGWWIGFKVEDDLAWQQVKDGELAMFSIEGSARRVPVAV